MKKRVVITILIWFIVLTACGLEGSGYGMSRTIWLDSPIETEATVNTDIALTVHANYNWPEISFGYNRVGQSDIYYWNIAMVPRNGYIYEGITTWRPSEPGEYNLRARSPDGVESEVRYIKVLPEETGSSGSPLLYGTPEASETIPSVMGVVEFFADSTNINQGDCTYLRWSTVFVERAYLDGEEVELSFSQQVCPVETTTYTLRGDYEGGSIEKTVTITVLPATPTPVSPTTAPILPTPTFTSTPQPSDTQGPSITGITKSVENVYDGPACGVTSNTITATVTDASGVSEVLLWYRAKRTSPAETGELLSIPMTKTTGNVYQAIIGIPELIDSLTYYADGIVEFYITARDNKGNTTQSGTQNFNTIMCIS